MRPHLRTVLFADSTRPHLCNDCAAESSTRSFRTQAEKRRGRDLNSRVREDNSLAGYRVKPLRHPCREFVARLVILFLKIIKLIVLFFSTIVELFNVFLVGFIKVFREMVF